MTLQEINRSCDVVDDSSVAQSRAAGKDIVFAVGAVAVVEIRRRGNITSLSQPLSYLLDKFIDTALVLHDYQPGNGPAPSGELT